MIFFVTDAAAAARIYLYDVGTANMRQIYNYPDSRIITSSIAPGAVLDAILTAHNNDLLDAEQYRRISAALEADLRREHIRVLNMDTQIIALSRAVLLKHKAQGERYALSHDAATYLATALRLAELSKPYDGRVIVVTADMALYKAAIAEPNVEAFHFWTCDMGCKCDIGIIPLRDKPGQIVACPSCGKTCPQCGHLMCPSTYKVDFE